MKFLEEIAELLNTKADSAQPLSLACQKFERRVYLSAGAVSLGDYRKFYHLLLEHMESLDPNLLSSLDGRTCNILHRNLDTAIEVFPESGSVIARLSTLVP